MAVTSKVISAGVLNEALFKGLVMFTTGGMFGSTGEVTVMAIADETVLSPELSKA